MTYAALVTGVWSGLLSLLVYGIARLLRVPMEVETVAGLQVIPWFAVLLLPLVAAEVGAVASLLVRGWKGAGRIVFWVGTVVAIASLVPLVMQPDSV